MKKIILTLAIITLAIICNAQQDAPPKKGPQKVVDKAKKVNEKSKEISDASNEVANQAQQAGENAKNIAKNVKAILKVFDPIFTFHFKKKTKAAVAASGQNNNPSNGSYPTGNTEPSQNTTLTNNGNEGAPPTNPNSNNQTMENYNGSNSQTQAYNYAPESNTYNTDGTMNMGHQNNGQYGNCLNLLEAKVMGMGEAEDNPNKIDLIFFSQYGGTSFSFESPLDAPTINEGVDVKKWRERNETEIAETKLTIGAFEKITTNTALLNAVKNTQGFGANFFTPNKMDGRVFAVRIMQDDKQISALLAVYKQFGTGGSKGYLQIKIKVQGVDKNTDGNPDTNAYLRQ